MDDWADVMTDALKRLWHACEVLGFRPDTIDPKHVALTAATLLGSQPDPFDDDPPASAPSEPIDPS